MGRRAPLALGPTALAAGLSVALVAQLGPVTLFHVLGVWILLSTGVDYAIFLIEHPVSVGDEAWFSVGLGAASTLLSFGLLGLSTTPAIAGFGLTVGVGTVLVWLVTPAIVDASRAEDSSPRHLSRLVPGPSGGSRSSRSSSGARAPDRHAR